MAVIFQNGVTFAAGETTLLKPELRALFDENIVSAEFPEGIISAMGYVKTRVINPSGVFSSVYGTPELAKIEEGQALPQLPTGASSGKWYELQPYGGTISLTKVMKDWLESGSTLEGADSSVKEAYANFVQNFKALKKSAIKSKNFEATRVLTEWWIGTNPNGAGSPTEYGQSLFSDTHPYNPNLAGTLADFRNVLGGDFGTADAALTVASLQNALDIHKSELRTYVGDRIMVPNAYTLMTGRRLGTEARKILQTPGTQVGTYSGTGSNAMQLNEFSFEGNKVALLEHPSIGAFSTQGAVGTDDMWFAINAEAAREAKALRNFVLNEGELDMWEDKATKTTIVSYYENCAFDHFGAQQFMVGSRGTA